MHDKIHLSDEELILVADGELSARRKTKALAHLEACWSCRERMRSIEQTISDFVSARNQDLDSRLPDPAGPRALLRARLAEASAASRAPLFGWRFAPVTGAVFCAVAVLFLIFGGRVRADGPKPKIALTPGEARPITVAEVCSRPDAEVIRRDIPEDMRRRVFIAYGIRSPGADQYEVDYLITPDLGGTESIRNLWPQPYSARWNAHVKDQLEQRLHDLVCGGKMDLATAQHEIATDWIAAWKKYVGTGAHPVANK